MNALPAAIIWSILLIVLMNFCIAPTWRRKHLPTTPRRLVKFAIVTFRQASPRARINGALFVSIVIMAIWMAL